MALNFTAVRKLCGLFVPGMRERKFGRILVTTSESHRLGLNMGLSHYAAAKSAALGYMRCLAAEVGHDNVTVNALSLGSMNNFEGHERAIVSTLVGRAGTPEDVGAAALYLCSEEAGWMTGQTIPLNGGACTA
jgi:NAD(P)-dependent dehydrogenase (short-subunit alcohol dehydrogenase family)